MSTACPTPNELRAMATRLRHAWGGALNLASKECATAMESAADLFEEIDKQYVALEALIAESSGNVKEASQDVVTENGSVGN